MIQKEESGGLEVGRLIRRLLFLAYVIGVLLAIDAILFVDQYRTAAWRDSGSVWLNATDRGRLFNVDVERWLRKSLW
jgi:hypothetical protein